MKQRLPAFAGSMSLALALVALVTSNLAASAAPAQQHTAAPTMGGTLTVAFSGDFSTLDPSQATSEADYETVGGALFNGLYDYGPNGAPELTLAAKPPTISADKKTWTFTLRKGLSFSDGTPLTADDVAYSVLRVLSPHTKPVPSWGQSSDEIFVGWQNFVAGKSSSVPGIQVLNPTTIRFVLTEPIAVFPDILAEPVNLVVPRALVQKEGDLAFASNPVGSGPYMLQSWTKGSQVVLVRNPHYYLPGRPYLDKVIIDVSVPASVIALRIEKGQLDAAASANDLSGADILQAKADPTYSKYIYPVPISSANWLAINVHSPLLAAKTLRQAIAMAIDRTRLVQLLRGAAIPAYQFYVPLMPQHGPALDQNPIYPLDQQKAMALVKASGYKGQPIVLDYATDRNWQSSIAPGIQQDLKAIGINLVLRGITHNEEYNIGGQLTGHDLMLADWGFDFPDAFDIYAGTFTCAANAAGGLGLAHFCDPTADNLVNQSEGLLLGPQRDALLREAQTRIIQSAAMVPLIFLKPSELASPHIGGFYFQPEYGLEYGDYWLQ
jgi:peptide/nickel transport system substrate-binding protein/oligopeptide transport system substrate-binding protein